jgi:hypothetical protein
MNFALSAFSEVQHSQNIQDHVYLSIGVTSSNGAGLCRVPGAGVFRGTGVRLCRILDMNFGEILFHALR